MKRYKLFRKDRMGRRGKGDDIDVREQLECTELWLGIDEELTEKLWVKIKERTSRGDITVGMKDHAQYRQMGAASRSQALVLNGGLQPI